MKNEHVTLVIGFDHTEGSDLTCLTIGRMEGPEYHMIKALWGSEAEKMYHKLIGAPASQS